jgi:DNA transformation protein
VTRAAARGARSLKVSDAFRSYVLDQLEELGEVVPKSMFGGVGLYHRGVFFGILARDRLYLKVDARNLPDYRQAGSRPFTPFPGRAGSMKYYEVPLAVLESSTELAAWARRSIAAAGG